MITLFYEINGERQRGHTQAGERVAHTKIRIGLRVHLHVHS